jgi:hypothetical protein
VACLAPSPRGEPAPREATRHAGIRAARTASGRRSRHRSARTRSACRAASAERIGERAVRPTRATGEWSGDPAGPRATIVRSGHIADGTPLSRRIAPANATRIVRGMPTAALKLSDARPADAASNAPGRRRRRWLSPPLDSHPARRTSFAPGRLDGEDIATHGAQAISRADGQCSAGRASSITGSRSIPVQTRVKTRGSATGLIHAAIADSPPDQCHRTDTFPRSARR